jgi:ribonuclease P/MRP protein subunit POP5
MVRLKNRYLLVNILYPDHHGSLPSAKVPDLVSFSQPTADDLTPHLLIKAIRAEVAELFGDYGSGAIAESLSSWLMRLVFDQLLLTFDSHSKVSFTGDFHIHTPSLSFPLQDCMGSIVTYECSARQKWQRVRLSSR